MLYKNSALLISALLIVSLVSGKAQNALSFPDVPANHWACAAVMDLQEGKISSERIAELKKRITATGVFGLKATCCLVPDAPVDCLLVNFGKQQQILYWDEIESPTYGMNSDPTPHFIKFKECWKTINQLAFANRPDNAVAVIGQLRILQSWYMKPAIQSKWRN